jgi:hypothetical protein
MKKRHRAAHAIDRFFFTPARALPLATLRIGLALVLLVQAALVAPVFHELYGPAGILQGPLRDACDQHDASNPNLLGALTHALARLGVGERPTINGVGAVYAIALLALLFGWRTRAAAALSWLTHMGLMASSRATVYGVDALAHVFLFYLVCVPAGAALSLDRRAGRARGDASKAARFGLRVIQIHLSIAYGASGVEKALGTQWWNGEAIWRALMLPEYRQLDFSWLSAHPWLAMGLGWAVLAVEIGYVFLIWPRRTRRLWVIATVALHLGIALLLGLRVFGATMPVFTLAAFGVRSDPERRR